MTVDHKQVVKATTALIKHIENTKQNEAEKKKKTALWQEDDVILLMLTLKKVPEKERTKPYRISIPYPLYGTDTEICVLVKDPQGDYKKKFEEQNVKVAKTIGVSKLRTNYKPFESKRQLCGSYDLFLADSRIIPLLPKLLGKTFFKKKKQPIPVDLKGKDLQREITKARMSTYLYLSGNGTCIAVRIARTKYSIDQIVQNITVGLSHIVENIPKKWKNIQSIHIKTSDSVALPIYNSLPEVVTRIQTEKSKTTDKQEMEIESETQNQEETKEETVESKPSESVSIVKSKKKESITKI